MAVWLQTFPRGLFVRRGSLFGRMDGTDINKKDNGKEYKWEKLDKNSVLEQYGKVPIG